MPGSDSRSKPDDARRKPLVRRKVIERRYGISPRCLDNWVARKTIPYYKVGGLLLFKVEDCDRALGRFEVKSK